MCLPLSLCLGQLQAALPSRCLSCESSPWRTVRWRDAPSSWEDSPFFLKGLFSTACVTATGTQHFSLCSWRCAHTRVLAQTHPHRCSSHAQPRCSSFPFGRVLSKCPLTLLVGSTPHVSFENLHFPQPHCIWLERIRSKPPAPGWPCDLSQVRQPSSWAKKVASWGDWRRGSSHWPCGSSGCQSWAIGGLPVISWGPSAKSEVKSKMEKVACFPFHNCSGDIFVVV